MTNHPAEEEWLSIPEAARRFGTSTKAFRRILTTDQTVVKHLTGRVLVRASDVERLAAESLAPYGSRKG